MNKIAETVSIVLVTLCCIITEVNSFRNRKDDSSESTSEKLSDFFEKPMVAGVCLLGLFGIYLVTRLFHLGIAPMGMHIDEIGMAYDAVCLSESGVDRWGHAMPVYLANFNTGQSAMYAYLTALLLKFAPFSVKLIRIPAVIIGAAAFFAFYVIGSEMTGKKLGGLIASTLMVINPFLLMSERWALDCNLYVSMAAVSMAVLIVAMKKDRVVGYLIAGLSWGLTLYTYILSYPVIPLFAVFVCVMIVRRRNGKNHTFGKIAAFLAPIFLFGLPLLLEQLVNLNFIPAFSFLGSDYFAFAAERAEQFSLLNVPGNIGTITYQLFTGDELTYNALEEFGPILRPLIPLIYYGLYLTVKKIVVAIKQKSWEGISSYALVLAFGVLAYLLTLSINGLGFNRYNELFLSFVIFELIALWEILNTQKLKAVLEAVPVLVTAVYFILFAKFYYTDMNDVYGFHLLFYPTEIGDEIRFSQNISESNKGKKYYILAQYDMLEGIDLMISIYGDVSQEDWLAYTNGQTGNSIGNYCLEFPEEFDENEDAVYIIGNDWNHITDYMISVGFAADRTFDNHVLLFK